MNKGAGLQPLPGSLLCPPKLTDSRPLPRAWRSGDLGVGHCAKDNPGLDPCLAGLFPGTVVKARSTALTPSDRADPQDAPSQRQPLLSLATGGASHLPQAPVGPAVCCPLISGSEVALSTAWRWEPHCPHVTDEQTEPLQTRTGGEGMGSQVRAGAPCSGCWLLPQCGHPPHTHWAEPGLCLPRIGPSPPSLNPHYSQKCCLLSCRRPGSSPGSSTEPHPGGGLLPCTQPGGNLNGPALTLQVPQSCPTACLAACPWGSLAPGPQQLPGEGGAGRPPPSGGRRRGKVMRTRECPDLGGSAGRFLEMGRGDAESQTGKCPLGKSWPHEAGLWPTL